MKKNLKFSAVLMLGIALSFIFPVHLSMALAPAVETDTIDLPEFSLICTKRTFDVGIFGFISIPVTSISCNNGWSEVYFM